MSARLDLSPDERRELARLLAGGPSLDSLLRAWSDFVTQVSRGYEDSIYEYTNDLSVRDRLARVADAAGPGLRAKLEARLAGDDDRFRAATADSPPLGTFRDTTPPWWWRRAPVRRVGELADDLDTLA